jgi:hypothetical protein
MDAPEGMPAVEDSEMPQESEGGKISVEVEIEMNGSTLDVKKKNLDLLMKRL